MSDAIRIDAGSVKRCPFPPPTPELFEAMARAGYDSNRDSPMRWYTDGKETSAPSDWIDQTDEFKDTIRAEARAMYAVMATRAGALVEQVPDEPPPPKATRRKGGAE